MKYLNENRRLAICVVFFFLLQLRLNQCYPMTSDDLLYLHGLHFDNINAMWDYALNWGNGRVLGNFLGLFLVRHELLRIFVKSFCLTGVYYLLLKLLKVKQTWLVILTAFLLSFPGTKMFAQIYVWTVAFADYLTPIFLFLLCSYLLCNYHNKEEKKKIHIIFSLIMSISILVLALAAQLFIEHCTVFFWIVSVTGVAAAIKYKKSIGVHVSQVLGCSVGMGMMFLIPKLYNKDYGNVGGYRGNTNLLSQIYQNIFNVGKFSIGCLWVWLFFSITMLFLIWKENDCFTGKKYGIIYRYSVSAIYVALPIVSLFFALDIYDIVNPRYELYYLLVFIIELAALFYSIYFMWKLEYIRGGAVLVGMAVLASAPLLLVSPNNYRTFYLSFLCLVISIIYVLNRLSQRYVPLPSMVAWGFCVAFLAQSVALLLIAGNWRYADQLRTKYFLRVAADHNIESIDLPKLPHDHLLQADPDSNYWEYVIQDYWDLEDGEKSGVQITWHDWYNWLNVKDNNYE